MVQRAQVEQLSFITRQCQQPNQRRVRSPREMVAARGPRPRVACRVHGLVSQFRPAEQPARREVDDLDRLAVRLARSTRPARRRECGSVELAVPRAAFAVSVDRSRDLGWSVGTRVAPLARTATA